MEPMTMMAVAGGAQVLGSVMQYYQAEKARKATEEQLDRIRELFEAIKPPDYDFSVDDPPELVTDIPEEQFDLSNLTPQQFAMVGQYIPQAAPYIAEKNPQLVQLSASGQAGREAQITALQALRDRTGQLADMEAQQAGDTALRKAQIGSQSRTQSILQDAQRRGQLGSGAMLAAQLQSGSDQMEQAADVSAKAALEAQREKLMALRDSGQMGANLAQQDFSQQNTNADIINRYNQRATSAQQNYENQVAQMRNQASLRNLDMQQNLANRNVQTANEYDVMNRKRQDALAEYKDKRAMNERDVTNANRKYQADFVRSQKDKLNNLRSQVYENDLARARGISGLGQFGIEKTYKDAADRNQAIQGVASGFGGVAQAYGNYSANKEMNDANNKAAMDRAVYMKTGQMPGQQAPQQNLTNYDYMNDPEGEYLPSDEPANQNYNLKRGKYY